MEHPDPPPFTITMVPDGDVIITVAPGTDLETDIHVEQDPEGHAITVNDVRFNSITGELVIGLGDREQRYDLSFLVPERR